MQLGTEQYFIEPVKSHSEVSDERGHPHLVYRRTALQHHPHHHHHQQQPAVSRSDISMCGLDSEGDVTAMSCLQMLRNTSCIQLEKLIIKRHASYCDGWCCNVVCLSVWSSGTCTGDPAKAVGRNELWTLRIIVHHFCPSTHVYQTTKPDAQNLLFLFLSADTRPLSVVVDGGDAEQILVQNVKVGQCDLAHTLNKLFVVSQVYFIRS